MTKYRYPLVPKEYFPAVMFACKLIRQNGFFHKAINSSAKYYGVDKTELERHVRARQVAGQRAKSAAKGRTYRYFIIARLMHAENQSLLKDGYYVVRGVSRDSLMRTWRQRSHDIDIGISRYNRHYEGVTEFRIYGDEDGYSTKVEAFTAMKQLPGQLPDELY